MIGNINNLAKISTDGKVPIYDEDIAHRFWYMGDIWLGEEGASKYVARINDIVYDFNGNICCIYRVKFVDDATLIPTLVEINVATTPTALTDSDILFGVGPGTQADTYRMYVDKSTTPYTCCIDQRLTVNGTMSRTCRVFKGAVLTNSGTVISQFYDNSGNFLNDTIPLEVVAINSHDNYAIKSIPPFKTTYNLEDGEIVTAVFYSDDGGVVSKRQLLVENTAFIRSQNASMKYISHINLECSFLSDPNSTVINYPVNLPVNSINMMGVVNYSDGSSLRYPVDGTKFSMLGMNSFVATIVGQEVELVLSYTLSSNEAAYGTVVTNEHYITRPYKLNVIDENKTLSVKLFAYPEWVDEETGYRLKFYMYTQDRYTWKDVTDKVAFDVRSGLFNGKLYGYRQFCSVTLNLHDVDSSYMKYIHTQNLDIVLLRAPNGIQPIWKIKSVADENTLYYGDELKAIVTGRNIGNYSISIKNDFDTYDDWVEHILDRVYPIHDSAFETKYPKPNYFYIVLENREYKHPIEDWDKELIVNNINNDSIYKNVGIRFTKELADNVLHIAYVELPLMR